MAVRDADLAQAIAGLDALESDPSKPTASARRLWSALWPKMAALALAVILWQIVVWTGWRPSYVLPPPASVLGAMGKLFGDAQFWRAVGITAQRAITGYALAVVLGVVVGVAVARVKVLRAAVGSLITGLQTMPSIAWFPLAILLFKLSEQAILFVVVLGAAPSIANGIIAGVDHVPPLLLRAGRMLGASGLAMFRHVILPAALPASVGGLKQGWAFAWRSLMAGELIVIVANKPSIGARLQFARELSDSEGLMALMLVVLLLGICVDAIFGRADRVIRERWGLVEA